MFRKGLASVSPLPVVHHSSQEGSVRREGGEAEAKFEKRPLLTRKLRDVWEGPVPAGEELRGRLQLLIELVMNLVGSQPPAGSHKIRAPSPGRGLVSALPQAWPASLATTSARTESLDLAQKAQS